MRLRAQPERITDVSRADLGQQLASRCHRLRLERFPRGIGKDLGRKQAGQQTILGQSIDHSQAAIAIQGHVQLAEVGARHPSQCLPRRALGLHLQRAVPARHEPQHTLVAHTHPGSAADRFQLPVRAINQLGEHARVCQGGLAGQCLKGMLGPFRLAKWPHPHQDLAPVEHLATHAKHGALLESAWLFTEVFPPLDLRVGFVPLSRFPAPHYRPMAQLGRHRR